MKYPDFLSPFVISPSIPIRWYGVMYIVGILCAYFCLRQSEKNGQLILTKAKDKKGRPTDNGGIFDMVFYGAAGAIIGARIGYFLLYSPSSFLTPWELLGIEISNGSFRFIGFSGMSFHGGVCGFFISLFIFAKKYKYNFYMLTDSTTVPMSLCIFFGRIGNFLNAELYGRLTDGMFGVLFPMYDAAGGYESWKDMIPAIRPYTDPRHPSQLYEAFLEGLVLAAIMYILSKNKKIKLGVRSFLWIAIYGLFRTLVESVREISEWHIGIFTAGMLYSIPMIILGTTMAIILSLKKSKN